MEFDKQKFSLAVVITAGTAYIICAAFTALLPDVALKFFGWMIHLADVEKFTGDVEITLGGFALGLLPILFYAYVGSYFFAWLYNRFTVKGVR